MRNVPAVRVDMGWLLRSGFAPDTAGPSWGAPKEVHFILDFMPDGFHAPFYVALDKGFFTEEGLTVKISRGYGSGDTVLKLAAGQYDIGLAAIGSLITARANENAAVKGIMLYLTRDMLTIWVRDEGKITSPKDLEGKTLSTTPGNGHFVMFPAFAKGVGFDASKVKWVTVDGAPPWGRCHQQADRRGAVLRLPRAAHRGAGGRARDQAQAVPLRRLRAEDLLHVADRPRRDDPRRTPTCSRASCAPPSRACGGPPTTATSPHGSS